jgi:hypothetical protein
VDFLFGSIDFFIKVNNIIQEAAFSSSTANIKYLCFVGIPVYQISRETNRLQADIDCIPG